MVNIEYFYKKYFSPGNISTDSRRIIENGIFVALKGENFNGNSFAAEAINLGASVAIVDEKEFENGENIFFVDNALAFLQQIAQYHRNNSGFKVIALTGTNGKTTTKELIKSVLCEKYKCEATSGNLNNHIGVPLTLLSIQSDIDFAIIEMGANHPGEIAALCEIAQPDYGLITNIGKAHLEGFGSFEGVIKTKSELYEFIISTNGYLFINASNSLLTGLIKNYRHIIKYNSNDSLSGNIISNLPTLKVEINFSQDENIVVNSSLYGEYNLENVLTAACIGNYFNLTPDLIKKGIEKYIPDNNRSQVLKCGSNTLILDCYNANPTSMHEAILSFSKINTASKMVILGGMRELGIYSSEEHQQVINELKNYSITKVLLVGEEFDNLNTYEYLHFMNMQQLRDYLEINKYQNQLILIKGSRGNKLEKIIDLLS